ncbi:hypothetical protein HDU76_007583, partial [Blyttiomyces sp. JEL0837]
MNALKDLQSQLNEFLTLHVDDHKDQQNSKSNNLQITTPSIASASSETLQESITVDTVADSFVVNPEGSADNDKSGGDTGTGPATVNVTSKREVNTHGDSLQRLLQDASYIGYLDKYGSISSLMKEKTWTKRFFALIDDRMFMYSNHQASKPLIGFPLTTSTVIHVCEEGDILEQRPWTFEIRSHDRVWIITSHTGAITPALPLPPMYTPGFFNPSPTHSLPLAIDQKEPPPPISAVSLDSYNAMMMSLARSGSEGQKAGLFNMHSPLMYSGYPNQVYESSNVSSVSISNLKTVVSPVASSSASSSSSSSTFGQPTNSPTTLADNVTITPSTTTSKRFKNLFTNKSTSTSSSSSPQLFRKKSTQFFEVGDVIMEGDYSQNLDTDSLSEWAKLQEKKFKDEVKQLKLDSMLKATETIMMEDQKKRQAAVTKGRKLTSVKPLFVDHDPDFTG